MERRAIASKLVVGVEQVEDVPLPVPVEIEASVSQIRCPSVDAKQGTRRQGSRVSERPQAILFCEHALVRELLQQRLSSRRVDFGEKLVDVSCDPSVEFGLRKAKPGVMESIRVEGGI